MTTAAQPLPFAPDRKAWSWFERSDLGVHGACDVAYRVPAGVGEGPELPPRLARALPLLLHELSGLRLDRLPAVDATERPGDLGALGSLGRVLPRLGTYRFVESSRERELVFAAGRPSSLHVLARVLGTPYRFRLEDLSHFATHGELVLEALEQYGLGDCLDPEAVIYCPALDSPFPFKFFPVGTAGPNRPTYQALLHRILRQTESDETFRARNFRELVRGFQKFGPASATPQFQEVELRLWRVLSYLAARLRVKAGRLGDAKDPSQVRQFLGELRHVHAALDDLGHLASRIAAYYRARFDLELANLHERVLPELDAIARRIDCDPTDFDRSVDAVAGLVSQFRRLGSISPLEALEEKDREIVAAYGDVPVPPATTGWARTYTAAIFTGAARFDTRRWGAAVEAGGELSEADLELDLDFGGDDQGEAPELVESDLTESGVDWRAPPEGLGDSGEDWRPSPGDSNDDWGAFSGETDVDLDSILGPDDGQGPDEGAG